MCKFKWHKKRISTKQKKSNKGLDVSTYKSLVNKEKIYYNFNCVTNKRK